MKEKETKLDQLHKLPPPEIARAFAGSRQKKDRRPKGRIVECPHCHNRFPIR